MTSAEKTGSESLSPAEIAQAMLLADRASAQLGMELVEIREGYCKMSMLVRDDMVNGLGICHGGLIFSLGDTAFAFACNSRNIRTVALNCTINFLNAANVGTKLTAEAVEKSLKGRTGLYDVAITNEEGLKIAEFRGTSYGTSAKTYVGIDQAVD